MNRTTERRRERRRTIIALAAAVLIHLLIVLAAILILSLHPEWRRQPAPMAAPEPVELTIIPPPEPTPPPEQKEFFDSAEGVTTEKAPENPTFESDQNTLAASKLPPQSNAPVPATDGTDETGLTLTARDLSLGPAKQPAAPAPASPAHEAQAPAKEPAKPQPKKPEEKPEEKPKSEEKPKPTPKPLPEESELAMLDPSRPKPQEQRPEPQPQPEKPRPPSRPQPPSFQPETRVTRLTGGISNQGDRASMASIATPLGRYKKMISDAIGSRWYYYVSDMIDLVNVGTVQLRFRVRPDGKVEGVQVLRNSSNESLASCSVRSIIEAEIPSMPKDVSAALAGSKLEIDYSFTIIGAGR